MAKPSIFLSAGEVSGDKYGALLAEALKELRPRIRLFGMGGERMRKAGVELVADVTPFSTVGIVEPFRYAYPILKAFYAVKRFLSVTKPHVLVVIDYQGFHMPLLKVAKRLDISSVYFIAPQEWQWGTEAGGRKVVERTRKIAAIFKEEADFYQKLGGNVVYVGHPLLDLVKSTGQSPRADKSLLAVFPGSRPQEFRLTAPLLLEAASRLQKIFSNLEVIVSIASSACRDRIDDLSRSIPEFTPCLYEGDPYTVMEAAKLSLATSGTVTLEHAILEKPCIVAYRFSPLSYFIGKKVLGKRFKKIPFISLPNLLLGREVCPEFLQEKATVENIVQTASELWMNETRYRQIQKELREVKSHLGEEGSIHRTAEEIVDMIS